MSNFWYMHLRCWAHQAKPHLDCDKTLAITHAWHHATGHMFANNPPEFATRRCVVILSPEGQARSPIHPSSVVQSSISGRPTRGVVSPWSDQGGRPETRPLPAAQSLYVPAWHRGRLVGAGRMAGRVLSVGQARRVAWAPPGEAAWVVHL